MTATHIQAERVASLLRDVARRHVMPRFQALVRSEIHEKAPGDLVTIADLEAEEALGAALREMLPGSLIVGEEACAKDGTLRARLDRDAVAWIIDPVDGTKNFAAGSSVFAMILALVRHGETVGAWIYDPVRDYMAMAEQGSGAWGEGQRLHVTPPETAPGSNRLPGSAFQLRCSGQHYLALARGLAQFGMYQGLQPWDHAAGVLLHAEAGGFNRLSDGRRYDATVENVTLLLAPDEARWLRFRDLLRKY